MVEAKDIDWCWDKLAKTNADGIRYVIDVKKSLQNENFVPKSIFLLPKIFSFFKLRKPKNYPIKRNKTWVFTSALI